MKSIDGMTDKPSSAAPAAARQLLVDKPRAIHHSQRPTQPAGVPLDGIAVAEREKTVLRTARLFNYGIGSPPAGRADVQSNAIMPFRSTI